MASSTSFPLDPGPMDVEDSIPAPTPKLSAGESSSNNSSSRNIDGDNHNPELAAWGGGAGNGPGGEERGRGLPPTPPAAVAVGASSGDGASAAEEKAEPSAAEVDHVPLPPSFDLDAYISRYSGYTKLRRLDWIAQRCPALAPECYRASLALLRQGINTQAYREISARASQLLGQEYAEDTEWSEQVDRRYQQSFDRLDAEMNSYKNNLIKESIRMGYNELGDLSYRRGDLKQALKCYARTRDYCTTNRHNAEMCLHVIEISADMRNFVHVNNYVLKAEHTPDIDAVVVAKLRAAAGLVYLDHKEYAKAARKFVEVAPELGSSFDGVVAPEDIAVYGGLCALATFSREEMKRKVLDNSSFKNFLDLVPQVRELMNDFANSRYQSCLGYLANLKGDLQLDLHLHMHLDRLYKMVEDKCLMQYFSPYTSVRLVAMSKAFGMEVPELESKVAELIISNQISARIDSTKSTLHAKHTEQRGVSCRKMHEMGDEYRRELRSMLVRMSCIEHDFIVRHRSFTSMPSDMLEESGDAVRRTLGEGAAGGGVASAAAASAAAAAAAAAASGAAASGAAAAAAGTAGAARGGAASGAAPDAAAAAAAVATATTAGAAMDGNPSDAAAAASSGGAGVREDEDGAGGADAERPPEAGGGSISMASGLDDAMDTVS